MLDIKIAPSKERNNLITKIVNVKETAKSSPQVIYSPSSEDMRIYGTKGQLKAIKELLNIK